MMERMFMFHLTVNFVVLVFNKNLQTVVCYFSAQLYAIVPLSSLQCYPMGGARTGPWGDPLATGWGTFDGEHNPAH